MKLTRPLQIALATRILEQDRRFFLVCSCAMGAGLSTGRALLAPEALSRLLKGLPEGVLMDEGMPKPMGEWLLSGAFHAPGGQAVRGHEVGVRAGALTKRLTLFGPRRWGPAAPTPPEPLATLPLEDRFAFGGPASRLNPAGLGLDDGRLPCIEDPDHLVAARGDRPTPAGFGPLPSGHPVRSRFQGTYDASYKERFYPGHPADLDWRAFMTAREDQRLEGFWKGDEPFELHHLHPDRPLLAGQLPGLRIRCFTARVEAPAFPPFAELPMNLDTVWFFPAQDLVWLIWRGAIQVADDEAAQVTHLLAAYEHLDRPRGQDHYRAALERRRTHPDPLQDELGAEDLIPEGDPCALELFQAMAPEAPRTLERNVAAKGRELAAQVEARRLQAMADLAARLEKSALPPQARQRLLETATPPPGQDPDMEALSARLENLLPGFQAGGPPRLKDFSFKALDDFLDAAKGIADGKVALARRKAAEAAGPARAALAQAGLPGLEGAARSLEGLDGALDPAAVPKPAPLPRLPSLDLDLKARLGSSLEGLLRQVHDARGPGVDAGRLRELARLLADPIGDKRAEIEAAQVKAQAAFREGYASAAHRLPPGTAPHPPAETLERLRGALAAGKAAEGDWACLDLSGADLRGADLHGSLMEQVSLRGADLRDARLAGAILARADLRGADLRGADLRGANLGAAEAGSARFEGAVLEGAILDTGRFAGARFTGCRMQGVQLMEACLDGADFGEALLDATLFLHLALRGASFREARLTRAIFLQGSLTDVDFEGAFLENTVWTDMRLERVRFDRARMPCACFVESEPGKGAMTGLSFRETRLDRAHLQGAALAGCDLSGASLEGACFGGASLAGAKLAGARAAQAQFRKADLEGADLTGADLRCGSLAKARLVQARFRGANLYGADVLRCTLGGTDFREANLDRTLLEGWRPE